MIRIEIDDELLKKYLKKKITNKYLSEIIKNRINKLLQNKKLQKGKYKNKKAKYIKFDKNAKNLLNWLNNENKIKKIISLKANKLIQFINAIENKYPDLKKKNSISYILVYNIFINQGYDKINKHKFIKNIDLKTCPYCNRNYIFAISKKGMIKGELDHFYPKDLYPYLGISYYNLIPSCQTCNGLNLKGSKDSKKLNLINPYLITNEDIKFTYFPQSSNIDDFKIDVSNKNNEKDKNIELFKLDELYKEHKDVVLDLLLKKAYYPKAYINNLKTFFNSSDEEIYRFLIGNYLKDEDLHKRPLSKLVKDIAEELKMIKLKNGEYVINENGI